MGGLLSAYELSKDKIFLQKADELGNRFLPAFDTPSGLPRTTINLAKYIFPKTYIYLLLI
jgi:uncharacterized protein YyaL (SSP411 family)